MSLGIAHFAKRRQHYAKRYLVSSVVLVVHANSASSSWLFFFWNFLYIFNPLFRLYCQNTSPLRVKETLPVEAAVKGLTAADFLGTLTAHGTVSMVQPVRPERHKAPFLGCTQSRVNEMDPRGLGLRRLREDKEIKRTSFFFVVMDKNSTITCSAQLNHMSKSTRVLCK